jgi:hypothetical protein
MSSLCAPALACGFLVNDLPGGTIQFQENAALGADALTAA